MSAISVSEFSSLNFREDWKLPFQQNIEYVPKFLPSDRIQIQYITTDFTLNPYVENLLTGTITQLTPVLLIDSPDCRCYNLIIDNSSVSDDTGFILYFASSPDGDRVENASFCVFMELPNTILLEYTNRKNANNTIFDNVDRFVFRVEGAFLPQEFTFENETEDFRDQRYIPKVLSSFAYETRTLTLGGGFGVPNWVARKINLIFALSSVHVNGVNMVRSEGSSVEVTILGNDYPLYLYKIVLEEGEDHDDSGDGLAEYLRAVDEKKKIIRRTSANDLRVYLENSGIDTAKMIRELDLISELSVNCTIEIDDNISGSTYKTTLTSLIRFISQDFVSFEKWNEYIDQRLRTIDDVKFNSVNLSDKIVSDDLLWGALGTGFGLIKKDSSGKSYLEIDKIYARVKATFAELEIRKLTYAGGNYVFSPAGMTCTEVVEMDDFFRCYFTSDDGEKAVENLFRVDDLVQSRESNIKPGIHENIGNRYYWRKCVGKGDNYIDLSKTICDVGSDNPQAGDSLVTIGNATDATRQNAIIISVFGEGSPSFTQYEGINSFSLHEKAKTIVSPSLNRFTGELHFSSGKTVSSAIDDVDKKADEAIDAAGQARNLADSAQKAADSAQQTANDAKSNALSAENSALEAKRAADNAHTAASAVNAELAKINDDNTISPSEKTALKQQQKDIQSEYNEIISSATRYSIDSTNYQNAYLSADSALIKYTSDTPEYIPIDSDYTNIGDYYTARQTILDAISSAANKKAEDAAKAAAEAATEASAAQAAADAALGALNNVNALIKDLQNQVDGAIQSYDGNVVPTLQNYPASEWSEEQEKIRHLGDIYYYYSTDAEGNSVTSTYKFRKVNGIYLWEKVANSESAANEAAIRELFNITNSKNSVYYGNTRPTPPYSVNDVWVKMDGSMYICNAGRSDGDTGLSTDWAIFNDAMLRLAKITSDDIISKEEKSSLRDIWSQIQKEFAKYQIQATTYSVSITTLRNAYDSLNTFLTNTAEISQDTDTSFSVPQKTQYNQLFADYYAARTDFANLIADKIAAGAVGSIQVGDTNLLDNSNKPWKSSNYLIASIQLGDYKPKHGEECTIVMKCKLGAGKEYFGVYNSGGRIRITDIGPLHINSDGIAVKTFPWVVSSAANTYINIYVISDAVVVESEIEWVKLVLGNKTSLQWTPSLNDQKETARQESQQVVDNLQIGSVNLISKKMMLRWNEKNKNIAVWGQDADGVYLGIHQGLLFSNWAESEALLNPIFDIKFKANTQYALSVEWKLGGKQAHAGLYLNICYTDGSKDYIVILNNQTTKIREDLVSQHGKTISKISSSYGSSEYRTYIYNISLIEGNKPLQGFPVAEEDSIGSSVNLANGTKEFTATALSGQNYEYGRCPMRVKPNTVYHVQAGNIENLSGNPSAYSFRIYNKDISQILALEPWVKNYDKNGGLLITKNDFEEQDGYLLCYAGVAGSTSGNSVKYTEVMLVEGFYPATAWVPSAGDVSKEISDVSSALSSFQTTVNGTFKDGIINKVEADTIASNINLLNTEKKDIDAQYTDLYSNTYLSGTAKTNLANAKTAYNTAHTNLINSINSAIADKKVTAAEKSDVNAKFTAYGTALATYQTRVQQAQQAIQDKVRESSVGDITKGSSYYVGKFSFAPNFGIFEFATTIPEKTNQMINVKISGYCYGDHTPFGMSLVFYTYETGMINYGYIVNGGDFISRVRLGIKNGKVRIELKLIKDVYYPGFNVDISSTRFDIPVSYSAGWTCVAKLISAGDYIDSTYSDIVTVPRKNSFSDALASKAQQAANNAQAAINAMNDDSIFDVQEKQIIRTQWENINGAANTTGTGTSGSYYKTKSLATGLSVSALDTAYTALRAYLHSMALYTNSNTSNFVRATMAAKFTTYYDAEIAINNAIANKLTQDYTDSKTYKTYIFDTATNEFDENKYYPITVKIPIAPEVKIAVSSVLGGSNKPLWSTHASGFSDICIWRTNGSEWGSSNVYRRIETFEYRFTKHEISPLGDVNQITQTSEEYIYVRGGGRYVVRIYGSEYNPPKIYTTAHTFPIDGNGNKGSIGPLDLTALFAQLNTATGEDIERIKNEINKIIKPPVVALKKIETQTEFNSERLSLIATETQYDELEKAGQTIVNRIDVVGSGISILSDKVNSIESSMAGMLVESDFVNIFAKYKDNAALSDAVISSINVSPEGVRIDGKNITITGQTLFKNNSGDTINFFGSGDDVFSINNGVFKVDKNGKLTATDATIEGNITANEGKFGGWVISSGAFVSNDFEYPVWGNDTVSGGKGSRISPDGGLMIMASGNGILRPSSGAKQAALIKAEGNNSHIIGLEVVARNTNSYGTFNEVIALKLRAETAYKNPATPPIALHIEKGDLIVQDGNFSASGAFSLGCQTVTSTTTLSSNTPHMILCKNTSEITVYLPKTAGLGRIIYVRRCNARVVVHGNGNNIYRKNSPQADFGLTDQGHMGRFEWGGDGWYTNWIDI